MSDARLRGIYMRNIPETMKALVAYGKNDYKLELTFNNNVIKIKDNKKFEDCVVDYYEGIRN